MGHCYSKREEARLPLFFAPYFLQPIFWTQFFSVSQTNPCFQRKNIRCRLIGRIYPWKSAFTPFIFYITLHYVKVLSHFWLNIQSVFYGNSVTAAVTTEFFSTWAKALWCGRLQEICMKLIPLRNDIGNKYSRSWLSRNCENFKKI